VKLRTNWICKPSKVKAVTGQLVTCSRIPEVLYVHNS